MTTTAQVPYQFSVNAMPAQRQFMESTSNEILYSGAFGAGKSRVGCEKGLYLNLKYPGNVGAIIRKTMASLRLTTMQEWFRNVMPTHLQKSFNQMTGILEMANGSKVIFVGLDDYLKIGSLELGWAFVDEAIEIEEQDYIMLLGRLRLNTVPFRQVMLATNPGAPSHFLYQRFYVQGVGEKVEANSLQNPYLPQDYKDNLSRFTGRYKERYVEGKWVGYEGLVYDNFNPASHILEPFSIPSHWRIYRSIDFGYSNPFVCQWWAEHPTFEYSSACPLHSPDTAPSSGIWPLDSHGKLLPPKCICCQCPSPIHTPGAMFRFREIYMSQVTADKHGQHIQRLSREPVSITFADHDSGDRAILEAQGVPTIKAHKDISQGIQTTYKAIDEGLCYFLKDSLVSIDYSLKEGSPPKPTCTEEEFGGYIWQPPRNQNNQKEEPRDSNNHGMDAMRYLFQTLRGSAASGDIIYGTKPSGIGYDEPISILGQNRNWNNFRSPSSWMNPRRFSR